MEDDAIGMEAMGSMAGAMPDPMAGDMSMGGEMDEMGTTNIPVPNFAVPAVMELIAMLEEEMAGGGEGGMMEAPMTAPEEDMAF